MRILKNIISLFFRVGISIALLLFLLRQVDKNTLFNIFKNADKSDILLAFFISSSVYILCFFRWRMLLNAVEIYLPFSRLIVSFAGGVFFNMFLPSSIGGDLVRSVDLSVYTKRTREVVATVFLDRLSGYIGLVIVVFLSLILGWKYIQDTTIIFYIAIIVGVLVIILFLLFNSFFFSRLNKFLSAPGAGRIKDILKDVHKEIHYFRKHKRIIIYNLFISTIIQGISPITFYLIALSLGVKVDLLYFFIFIPIIGAITMLPISLGGLGVRDFLIIFFFYKLGVVKDMAFSMSIINSFFMLVYAGLGGLIYVLGVHNRRVQRN